MPFGKFSKLVLIFGLNGNATSHNTAKRRQQADRLPIQTVNRHNTPHKMQKRRQDFSSRLSIRKFIFQTSLHLYLFADRLFLLCQKFLPILPQHPETKMPEVSDQAGDF